LGKGSLIVLDRYIILKYKYSDRHFCAAGVRRIQLVEIKQQFESTAKIICGKFRDVSNNYERIYRYVYG